MKYKIIFLLLTLAIILPIETSAFTERDRVLQQIEIAKREISVIRRLINNLNLRQNPAASAHIVIDISNQTILSEVNADLPYPIASITKLMSAIVATENIPQDKTITLTPEMLRPLGRSPVFQPGFSFTAKELIKASLIQSTNDASEALSFFMERGSFVTLMNQKANEVGMTNTIFHDAHGLNPDNKSTARDLVKLMSYTFENHPELLAISKNNDFWLPDSNGRLLKFQNMNDFYPLSNFIGGKTGYLTKARQTLASIFNINNRPTAIIILRSDNRQADLFSILRKISK